MREKGKKRKDRLFLMSQPTYCDVQKETQKRKNPFKGGGKDVCVCGTNAFAKICWLFFWNPRQQISFSLLLLRPREEEGRKWECCLPLIKEKKRKERLLLHPSFYGRSRVVLCGKNLRAFIGGSMLRAFLDCFSPKLMHSKIRKLQFSSFRETASTSSTELPNRRQDR